MKPRRFLGTLILAAAGATMLGLGSAHAQTALDMDRLWCIRMRESLVRNYQAVDRMRAEREAGIRRLRAEQEVQAHRNLQDWYWKRVADLFEQKRVLEAECRTIELRADRPSPDRMSPRPRSQAPRSNQQETRRYPPYERYPEPTDPFSPDVRR